MCVLGKRGEDQERGDGGEDRRDMRTEEKEAENGEGRTGTNRSTGREGKGSKCLWEASWGERVSETS